MASVLLDRFSSGNPDEWIFRAENYFTYLGFPEKEWLPLPSLYLDGEALDWFHWMYRNNQFFNWKHFTEKLALCFHKRTYGDSPLVDTQITSILALLWKMQDNNSIISKQLDKIQLSTSSLSKLTGLPPTMTQEVAVEDVTDSAATICNGEIASALAAGNSGIVDHFMVHSETFDTSIDTKLLLTVIDSTLADEYSSDVNWVKQALPLDESAPVFKDLMVSNSDPSSDLHDGILEEVSGIYACNVFVEMPDKELDMEVVDSVKNDLVKFELQVFDETFHTIFTIKGDSSNLVKFDKMLLALPRMLSTCSPGRGIVAYLSELDHARLPLSLYQLPPDQFELGFPFDPGSTLLTSFIGTTSYHIFIVVDDLKEIIKILACHIDSSSNDQCILNQFLFDSHANLFIITPDGRLQVHQLPTGTFIPALVLVKDTFQMWDPGIHLDFMDVIGTLDNVEAETLFEAIRKRWSSLLAKFSDCEQLGGVVLGIAAFDSMYLYICFWVYKSIEDQHLDYSFMENELGFPLKELHSDEDMVRISEFIVSTKIMCKILEHTVGNQLRDARRKN